MEEEIYRSILDNSFALAALVDRSSQKMSVIAENGLFRAILDETDDFEEFSKRFIETLDFEYKALLSRFKILDDLKEKRVVVLKSKSSNWYKVSIVPVDGERFVLLISEENHGYQAFLKASRKKVKNTSSVIHDLFRSNCVFAFIVYPRRDKIIYYVFNGEKELVEVPEDRAWSRSYNDYCRTLHPDDRQAFYEATHYGKFGDMKENDSIEVMFRSQILTPEFRWYRGLITARIVENEDHPDMDPELGVIALVSDINDEVELRERLKSKSITDSLTGLFNRTKMDEKFDEWRDRDDPCSVIFMDINDLKRTNDIEGHEAGDKLIKDATSPLSLLSDAGYEVFRYGGDEFVAIGEDRSEQDIQALISHYVDELSAKGLCNRVAYGFVRGEPKRKLSSIIREADIEMYRCKKAMKQGECR